MGVTALLDAPFYAGGGTSSDVPGKWPCAIDGLGFLLDTASPDFGFASIPVIRQQGDNADQPSERSLNPEDLWRRSAETWHGGAGQEFLDRPDSVPSRFRSSKGVDCWTRNQIGLLPTTASKKSSANTNLRLVVAGSRVYVTDGTTISYTTDPTVGSPTWTALTGHPANAATSIASNGYYVWTAHGSNGIYRTDTTSGATASHVTGTVALVGYVKGRLMAANGASLYNVTAAGALPTALLTHSSAGFTWVGFAEGTGHLYAAGYSGDKSEIFKTAVKADGTALDVPSVAGRLPDGEVIRSIVGYLGFIVIGSDKGIRFATANTSGDLTIGGLIEMSAAPYCFEGQDRFVWFGWTNYDGSSTGLGRLDLSFFNGTAPAYASDLMATAQGQVQSVITFGDRRYFTVSGSGVWGESTDLVTSGTIDSGFITYGLPERKRTVEIDTRHLPLVGSYTVSLAVDDGTFTQLGTRSTAGSTDAAPLPTSQKAGELIEVRLVLSRDGTATSTGPTVTRWTLRSEPLVDPTFHVVLPVLLYEDLSPFGFADESMDPTSRLEHLIGVWSDHRLVNVQVGCFQYSGFITDWRWAPHHQNEAKSCFQGTFTAKIKVV